MPTGFRMLMIQKQHCYRALLSNDGLVHYMAIFLLRKMKIQFVCRGNVTCTNTSIVVHCYCLKARKRLYNVEENSE